jgi:AcrR family transcriptional regulator
MVTTTRERIIEATSRLFMERGYAASGLKEISKAGTAPIGSLYHFFPGGKEELAAETLRTSGVAYQALVEAVLDSAPDLVSGVAACYEGAAEVLRETDYADACPIATVALEVASTNDHLRAVTAEIFESWITAATERFARGGVIPQQARDLAVVLVAALEGGFLLSRAARDTAAMDAIGGAMVRLVSGATTTSE